MTSICMPSLPREEVSSRSFGHAPLGRNGKGGGGSSPAQLVKRLVFELELVQHGLFASVSSIERRVGYIVGFVGWKKERLCSGIMVGEGGP